MADKVYALADPGKGNYVYAVGPIEDVGSKLRDLKDQIEDIGWTSRGTVYALSPAAFERMRKSIKGEA